MKKLFQTLLNLKSSVKTRWNWIWNSNEIKYGKLYPSGSAPARIYGTPKMHKFSSSDSFPKLCPIFSSIGTFNYNLACFLCDLQDPTLKCEASLQRFLCKLKQKNFFNEIEYDKLYPSGSAPACIYGTPKMHKFYSSDSFPKLCPIVSSIGFLIIIFPVSFVIFFHL